MITPRPEIANNASWCTLICQLAGVDSHIDGSVWRSDETPPAYYPDLVTLAPGQHDLANATAVKDSYAELTPTGFDLLIDGRWISHPPSEPIKWNRLVDDTQLEAWSRLTGNPLPAPVLRALVAVPEAAVLLSPDGKSGCTAFRSHGVVGVTNVAGGRPEIPGAVASVFPGVPLVGYESGAHLDDATAAAWTTLGRVRVWVRSS